MNEIDPRFTSAAPSGAAVVWGSGKRRMPAVRTILFLLLACSSILPVSVRAQIREMKDIGARMELWYASPPAFGIGVRAGVAQFVGDMQEPLLFEGSRAPLMPSVSLFAHFRLFKINDSLRLGLDATAGAMRLASSHPTHAFRSEAWPVTLSLIGELYPRSRVRPLISIGIGALPYDLRVTSSTITSGYKRITGSERGIAFWFPIRLGVAWSMTRAFDLQLIAERSIALSDRLDGLVTKDLSWQNDNFQGVSAGIGWYLMTDAWADDDRDGISNADEEIIGTDPSNPDTDGDGLRDGDEFYRYHTDPLVRDTDGDGLIDGEEVQVFRTNPLKADTDGDGISDREEIGALTDPLSRDTDGDGIPDGTDRCPRDPETPNGVDDFDGCPDSVSPPAPKEEPFDYFRLGQMFVLENIEFETGRATITAASIPELDRLARTLRAHPDVFFEIGGHTDSTGNYERNLTLSRERAEAVRAYLMRAGVSGDRMQARGFGPSQPVAPNTTQEGRARNRRIEFRVLRANR